MSVGLLIITNNKIGQELVATAASIPGNKSLTIHTMSVPANLGTGRLCGSDLKCNY